MTRWQGYTHTQATLQGEAYGQFTLGTNIPWQGETPDGFL